METEDKHCAHLSVQVHHIHYSCPLVTITIGQFYTLSLKYVYFYCIKEASMYLHIIYRFHKPWGCHEKSRIGHTPSCGNNLTRSTMKWLRCNPSINNFEFNISNWLITEWSFSRTPLKTVKENMKRLMIFAGNKLEQ